MSYFIYTDLISNLFDTRFIEPESTSIHFGTYALEVHSKPGQIKYFYPFIQYSLLLAWI